MFKNNFITSVVVSVFCLSIYAIFCPDLQSGFLNGCAIAINGTMLHGEQSSDCNGWNKKDNGGRGDDGMAETPGEQKTMLEDHAQRDGQQCQAVVEAPLLEVPFGGEKNVNDDGLTDDYGINNHSNKHNSWHGTAFTEVSFRGEEHVQMIVYDDGLTYGINNKSRHCTAFTEDALSVTSCPGAISLFFLGIFYGWLIFAETLRFGVRRFYAANVFCALLSLSLGAARFKQMDSELDSAKTTTADGGTWWIWATAVLLLLLLLLLVGGGLAFVVWKKRRQSAPTVPAITVEVPADENEIEMTEMAAAPTRRWEAYPGAWNTATGSFKGGQALF